MKRGMLLALTLLLAAPAASIVGQESGEQIPEARTRKGRVKYKKALGVWTRDLKLYANFETKLLLRAVYKSEAFRDAWTDEYSRRYMLPKEERALLAERQRDDARRFHEVLFAVWAADSKNGHFIGDDAPWNLHLVTESGESVAPLVVTRIKRPSTELVELYPFITPHDRVFVAKFPVLGDDGTPLLAPESKQVSLRVAGVLARGQVTWDL